MFAQVIGMSGNTHGKVDFHGKFSREFLNCVKEIAKKEGKSQSDVIQELAMKGLKIKSLEIFRKEVIKFILDYKKLEVKKSVDVNKERLRALIDVLRDLCSNYLRCNDEEKAKHIADQIKSVLWSIQTEAHGGLSPIETSMLESITKVIIGVEKVDSLEFRDAIEQLRNTLKQRAMYE